MDDIYTDKAQLMMSFANEKRIKILEILSNEEVAVGALAERVGLSQSALSQHLAKLRQDDLVSIRRDAQTIYYSTSNPRVRAILEILSQIFKDAEPERNKDKKIAI